MNAAQQTLLKRHLSDAYVGNLPPLLQPSADAAQNEQKNLARSISAFVVHHHCGATVAQACASVVDDFGDLGIDAIYYQADIKTLFLIQSKLKASEQFTQDEANAFGQGIRKLIASDYNGFNQNVLDRQVELDAALDDCERIQLVVAHTGDHLRQYPAQAIADLIADPAHGEERLVDPVLDFAAQDILTALHDVNAHERIDCRLTLLDWAKVSGARTAYIGLAKVEEPRILIEDPAKSYHAAARISDADIFDNVLIHGDNLLALKALEADYAGKVKCVFIDPPYNTGSAFTHYDDGLEHSIWLGLMRDRLEIIRRLLSEDGSLWITIDDNEAHYLKVMCDEIFGRPNFIGNIIWEKSDSPRMDAVFLSGRHDHLLVYARDISNTLWQRMGVDEDNLPAHYDKVDEQGRKYYLKPLRAMGGQGDSRATRPTLYYSLTAPDGSEVFPVRQDGSDGAWRWSSKKSTDEIDRIDWVKGRNGWTPYYRIFADTGSGRPIESIWPHADVGSNRTSKAEVKALFPDQVAFGTPKPERLLKRIIEIATKPDDLVFDSFAGSGTTGAVAHKMGRRWIMVELGDHCTTHVAPRLRQVIDGTDQGGISKAVEWKGGGGFRYFELAPSLLDTDKWGREVISPEYDAAMLAQAVCKLEGFTYAPSDSVYWQQGHSSESDFLYVTTQTLGPEELAALSEEVGEGRSLLILCAAFRGNADLWPNLTLRKIPNHIRSKCEWGHDDYSLNVANLPMADKQPPPPPPAQSGLFDGEDAA